MRRKLSGLQVHVAPLDFLLLVGFLMACPGRLQPVSAEPPDGNRPGVASSAEAPSGGALGEPTAPAADRSTTSAEWLWITPRREPGQQAFFRKEFVLPAVPRAARLICVADSCHARLMINGHQVARLEPFDERLRRDVSGYLRSGTNVIAIGCRSVDGPAAVFVHLDGRDAEDRPGSLVSDTSWKVAAEAPDGWRDAAFDDSGWSHAASLGHVAADPWGTLDDDTRISPFDDYTQWKRATGEAGEADPATFLTRPGFSVERLKTAAGDEGSWVSMVFDPRGRLILAREKQGLLRLTFPAEGRGEIGVEVINDSLQECRGLLFAHNSLYANANNSKALYRLRDIDGDDRFDSVESLHESSGGVGHGRNDLALGPDGRIYSIHGDSVDLPREVTDLTSPFREHRRGTATREGHVVRLAPNGRGLQVVAAGLRNPFGIDFNADGELFTYDADAEFDMGAPWYRPTRVVHITAGADYGWRGVTGQWPPYFPDHPDNGPPALDIGKGSPTAVMFGTDSHFPPHYRRALFILDWAYGRILAVHMTPRGAGYACRAETFLRGRPLNVTDLAFGPDGAMYFITGGRGTQSALYRVRSTPTRAAEPAPTAQQQARAAHGRRARAVRRRLEDYLLPDADDAKLALRAAWPLLDDPDPRICYAARNAVEHQPVDLWWERAMNEPRETAAVTALVALARSGRKDLFPQVVDRLNHLPLKDLTASQKLLALQAYRLCLVEDGAGPEPLAPEVRRDAVRQLRSIYPSRSPAIDQAVVRLLVPLDGPEVLDESLELLRAAGDPTERLFYLFVLRNVRDGWNLTQRRDYFRALGDADQVVGGQGMPGFLKQIRDDAVSTLSDDEREALSDVLDKSPSAKDEAQLAEFANRPFVRKWQVEDLLPHVARFGGERSFEQGQRVFREALCGHCHRLADRGASVGPDLTAVGNRFSRKDLLISILQPSRVVAENYRSARIQTDDGKVLIGQVRPGGDYRDPSLRIVPDLLHPEEMVTVAKSRMETHDWSPLSPMPAGLLDTFDADQILDLLAYLESGGNPKHPVFAP